MKIFSVPCFLFVCISFLGCQKNPDPTKALSKTDYISASAWTYENSGIDNDRNGTIDVPMTAIAPTLVLPCKIDNTISFKRDNTGTIDEGATKCNTADPQTSVLSWNFADNEANLFVNNTAFPLLNGKSKILALTANSMSLTRDTVIASTTLALVVILKH
ncbi:MAG: hypothetical protein M3Y85_02735 [Bacteroidota bacterium]|nr:hypothetical protein [Bacteroidota bacterium]